MTQVIEIVLHVALNTWTNYINEDARTDADFPLITARSAAKRPPPVMARQAPHALGR